MLDETTVMELIIYAGEARSSSMEALSAARKYDWDKAEELLNTASVAARKAHQIQTALIGADEGSGKIPVNLILVHAQDHLMNAMLCRELVEELIQLHREISALKQSVNDIVCK
ncbi:PTS lactose/cellobiose transporter subunit IIA [Pectobacterium actinidiae]|uniref:PTS lactose/cellobiose transporter subunit IIA n=1 Tax=Pectobacterium actinidiae TaxID=1507808 RepID=A0A1V2R021_9GAMM|nr:PTS lactose/cellobiose transporter subunit IIA [Pectobacterium actinidiae]QDX99218.1 PTS lactose/cellobiose transporter subunit IIA [Pectobacterium carotovorum subsp. carotovorum]KHN89670.1 pts system, cellobiose-specific IIA component [Pectobacterium actinidiae]MDY4317028.1 PTS lactose/cellobiose transporter subunit IIA [Pectobacterium actinidiae]ONK01813.1 PTS lactose/cellobiose transporter subunit IIA [Pectobacterium actinidiae]ONK02440.1 PTS lactose/cellobiose transporter subunit IIA [P